MRDVLKSIVFVAYVGVAGTAWAAGTGHSHHSYSAGEPGNPKQKFRVVEIDMNEGDGKMSYSIGNLNVKRGEQIKFVLKNTGQLKHEFMLATVKENVEHGKAMEKFPDMEHEDANGKSLEPGRKTEMLWKFTKAGAFEFACLIPGHHQAGMHGMIVVK